MENLQISRPDALLIVCQALNAAVDSKLLKDGQPAPGVGDVEIGKTMKTLNKHDQEHGEHAVDLILNKIVADVKEKGFDLTLGKGQLVNDFETVNQLVTHIVRNSRKS
jgi:hypothetical protein